MGKFFGWIGNATKNTWDWTTKTVGQGLEFAWSLPGVTAEQARILSERQAAAMGKTISETQAAAAGQQRFLSENVSMNNMIIIALIAAVVVALFARK